MQLVLTQKKKKKKKTMEFIKISLFVAFYLFIFNVSFAA